MNVLDLFSGIGGFSLGLERAGMRTVAFCEYEEFPRRVLAKHWPDVPCYPDVRELTKEQLDSDGIGSIDLVCGGFPCQDISQAGRGAGIDGARSGLWSEFARLIGEIRPRFAIVENVAALSFRGLLRVLGDLTEIGYDAEWHCIPACAIGAPHIRERYWIVAYARGEFENRTVLTQDRYELGRKSTKRGQDWELFALVPGVPAGFGKWREMGQPGLVPPDDGLPGTLDELSAYGNAVVPQVVEVIGRAIMETEQRRAA